MEKKSVEQEAAKASESDQPAVQEPALGETPTKAVHEFLEAAKAGDDKKAERLLTKKAKENNDKIDNRIVLEGSPTAQFEVGEVDYVDEGARVLSTWTDINPQGHEQTNRFIWILRKEPEGWRVAGTAVELFPGEPPLVLNYEDPEDMNRQKKLAEIEIQRRHRQKELAEDEIYRRQNLQRAEQAKAPGNSGQSIHR